jgi:hypothetical protein
MAAIAFKGVHCEHNGYFWRQKLLDLDGPVDRRFDGLAAGAGWKLKSRV